MPKRIKTTPIATMKPIKPDPEVLAITFCVEAIETISDVETRARIAWYINERFGDRAASASQA